jgi:chaperonin GroEL
MEVRGAFEEGIQPGGGMAFLNIIPVLEVVEPQCMEEVAALRCLERAFEAPLRQLVANAGQDGAVVVEEVRRRQDEARNPFIGYNVLRREFGDLREWGILDSTRMARAVVQNAISAASILLTIEATVGLIPGQEQAIRTL